MNIKEGMKLWAVDPCVMDGKPTLTVGKCYEVKVVVRRTFTVIDDDGRDHYFGATYTSKYFRPYPPVDWSKAPEWANWWAMDADGRAWWYNEKPMFSALCGGSWHVDNGLTDRYTFNKYTDLHGFEWKQTLEKRPEKVEQPETLERGLDGGVVEFHKRFNIDDFEELTDRPETLEQRKARLEKELEEVEREIAEYKDEVRIEGHIELLDHIGYAAWSSEDGYAMEVNVDYHAFIEEKDGIQYIKFKKK